jgi:hypothetical protein
LTSPKNLDGDDGRKDRRAHVLTEALMDALDKKDLWYDYGIVADIMVSASIVV